MEVGDDTQYHLQLITPSDKLSTREVLGHHRVLSLQEHSLAPAHYMVSKVSYSFLLQ